MSTVVHHTLPTARYRSYSKVMRGVTLAFWAETYAVKAGGDILDKPKLRVWLGWNAGYFRLWKKFT